MSRYDRLVILALIVSAHQAQIIVQLYYSDHLRFIADSRLAGELDQLIRGVQPDNQKLPVALVGGKDTMANMPPYVIHGEEIVHSIFTYSSLTFMGKRARLE